MPTMPTYGSFGQAKGYNANPTKKKKENTGSSKTRGTASGTKTQTVEPKTTPPAPLSPIGGSASLMANSLNTQGATPTTFNYNGTPSLSANSYVSPTATPSGVASSTLPNQGTDPMGGFMGTFSPGMAQDMIYRDPQIVLNEMFQQNGWNTSSPMYATMRDFYGADPQSLWMLLNGSQKGNFGGAEDYGNFLNGLYVDMMTPNGRGIDFNEILGIIGGQGDQTGLGPDQQSPLWQLLTSGGASEQFRTLYGLLGDAAKVGLAPAMASAFMDALARSGDTYLTNQAKSDEPLDPYFSNFRNPMVGR